MDFGRRRALGVIAGIATVLLVGALVVFLWMENQAEKKREAAYTKMQKELSPLELERYQCRQELEKLNKEYDRKSQGMASLVLLFTDMDEIIYTEIYPKMQEYGFNGVLALSEGHFPGQEGCLSLEQFEELVEAGWEYCLSWEEKGADSKKWLMSCDRLVRQIGISRSETVYFSSDTYRGELDSFLEKGEFTIAVHHGEENLPLILCEAHGGVWHPGAMAWDQDGVITMLDEVVLQGGNLIFTVGSDSEAERYIEDAYLNMLESLQNYCQSGDLIVTTLTGARKYREQVQEERGTLEEEYKDRRTELEVQIERLGQEIDEITEKYVKEWE